MFSYVKLWNDLLLWYKLEILFIDIKLLLFLNL